MCNVQSTVVFFLERRVLPNPRSKSISRSRINDVSCGMMFCNEITAPSIDSCMNALTFDNFGTFYVVDHDIALLNYFNYLDAFDFTGIRFLAAAPRIKCGLIQNDMFVVNYFEHF